MNLSAGRWILLASSLAGVPLLFGTFVAVSYRVALRRGMLPFLGDHEWRWWAAFGVLLVCGSGCIYAVAPGYVTRRWLALTGYLVVMAITLGVVAFVVSCMQGDCL